MINLNDRFEPKERKAFVLWVDDGEGWFEHSFYDTEDAADDVAAIFDRAYVIKDD